MNGQKVCQKNLSWSNISSGYNFHQENQYIITVQYFYYQKMKRQYSFNEISRITMGASENENKIQPQPYYTSGKSRDCWTDIRVEEIKKKYDTPSHRKNYSHYGNNEKTKEPNAQIQQNNPYSSYRNPLRDSVTFNNVAKRDKMTFGSNMKEEVSVRASWDDTQHVPRFSYDSKENNNFLEKFSQIKNNMKIQQKPAVAKENIKTRDYPVALTATNPTSKIDPRVQNIDKINMKIKKILDCLNENDKYPKAEERCDMKSSFMRGSIISKGNQSEELEETKILSRQNIGELKSNMKKSITSNQKFQPSSGSLVYPYKFEQRQDQKGKTPQSKWKYEDRYGNNRPSQSLLNANKGEKVQDQTDSWFEPSKNGVTKNRSRSCLGNFKQDEIKLNSGKKLDDEISKINVRIKEFEEEKKKLNIEFKPYNYQLKYNRSSSNLADHKTQRSVKPPLPRPVSKASEFNPSGSFVPTRYDYQMKMKTEANQSLNRSSFENKKQYELPQRFTVENTRPSRPLVEYQPSQEQKMLNRASSSVQMSFQSSKFDLRRENTNTPSFQAQEQESIQQEPEPAAESSKANKFSQELKQKTEQGIQERKRKLLQTATVSFSRETKRLITNLFEQVKLDEDLRNAKIWLRDLMDSRKWDQLKEEARRAGIKFDKSQFEVTQEEDNPFYSVRESEQTLSCLVNRWIKAQKYWQQNLAGQFNLREFQVQRFTEDKVDLEKKGYFVVEDLVRFLNMETGTFYRNRDLILTFRRLTSSDKLLWQQFLQKLDQSYSQKP